MRKIGGPSGVFGCAEDIGGLHGGGPDASEPPLALQPVCGIANTQTRPQTFEAWRWMAKKTSGHRGLDI